MQKIKRATIPFNRIEEVPKPMSFDGDKWYGLFDNELVSFLSVIEFKNTVRIKSLYTFKDKRNHGYASKLVDKVCESYKDKSFTTYAFKTSKKLFKDKGFEVKRVQKAGSWKVFVMERGEN